MRHGGVGVLSSNAGTVTRASAKRGRTKFCVCFYLVSHFVSHLFLRSYRFYLRELDEVRDKVRDKVSTNSGRYPFSHGL